MLLAMRSWCLFGLGRKLALFTSLLLALTTCVMVVVTSLTEEARLEARLVERAGDMARLMARFTASYEHDLRLDELKMTFEDVLAQGTVAYIYVLDAENVVLVDGQDETRLFDKLLDPLAERARLSSVLELSWDVDNLHLAHPVSLSDGTSGTVRLGLSLVSIGHDIAAMRRRNIIVGGVIGCGALLLSLLLAQRVTRPLKALSAATAQVARGDLSGKIAYAGRDELGQLALNFNAMIDHLETSAREITKLAYGDPLTGLPNRHRFGLDLEGVLEQGREAGRSVAVLCLDLDHFKEVNDTLGHAAGDLLLRRMAERLQLELGAGDMIARLGGDEFAIIRPGGCDSEELQDLCRRLVRAAAKPFDLDGHEIVAGTSIGVALFPEDGEHADDLLKCADLALYRVKAEGRSGYRMFESVMRARLQARKRLEQDLRHAIERGELELYYQPQIELRTGLVLGAEALMRWRHPVLGMVPPSEFIPVAEETGLIAELGAWALLEGCREAATWPHGKIAINLSPVQFRQPDLAEQVSKALRLSGLSPGRLELEITEGVLMRDTDDTLAALAAIETLGARIALDDFGTGFSSLSYLRRFPFGKIKIDRSFVIGLGRDGEASAVVQAIIELCHNLGMAANAEGVETVEEARALRRLGCDEAQGYLYSPPCAAAEFRTLLSAPIPTLAIAA